MPSNPVTHPSPDILHLFGQGRLDVATANDVRRHVENCLECQGKMAMQPNEQLRNLLSGSASGNTTRQPAGGTEQPPARTADYEPWPSTMNPETAAAALAGRGGPMAGTPLHAVPNLPPELANNPQYQVVRELGRGGMGIVYLARNVLMDRLEVLKVVKQELLDRPGSAERFLREIRSAARLSHGNVVKAYSALALGNLLVFAMEYVEGEDLARVVHQQGPLPVTHACLYTYQTALGLQHAHEQGLIHRDIKPHNLILHRQGKKHVVKVFDFGLAKATREGDVDTALTGTGMMMGTPDFVAPEQTLDAASAGIRADIYSLGCTLYYMLTGSPPFKGKNIYDVMQAHISQEAIPLNQMRGDVPAELAAVVAKMMAKDPAHRYQKPMDAAQALLPFVKTNVPPLKPPAPATPAPVSPAPVSPAFRPEPIKKNSGPPAAAPAPPKREKPILDALPAAPAKKKASASKAPNATARAPKKSRFKYDLTVAVVVLLGLTGLWIGVAYWMNNAPSGQSSYDLTGGFRFVHFGPEGPRVVIAGKNKAALVCDLTTEKVLGSPMKHGNNVLCAVFSPDGKRVVTCGEDNTARVWNAVTGEAVSPVLKHTGTVRSAAFSPDGSRVVTASNDRTAQVWDVATGKPLLSPALKHDDYVRYAVFSPDGKRVLTASEDKTARVWDAATGQPVTPSLKHGDYVRFAAFSPDGKRVATASDDKTARVWDAATGQPVTPSLQHTDWVGHVAFSPDGKYLATASTDKTAMVWDAATGKPIGSPLLHKNKVEHVTFSPDGKRVLTASRDNTARVWDALTGKVLTAPLNHDNTVYLASFSPDGKRIVTASDDRTVRLWDAEKGTLLKKVTVER